MFSICNSMLKITHGQSSLTHTPPDDLLHVLPPPGALDKVCYVQFKRRRRSNHPITANVSALFGREARRHDSNTGAQQLARAWTSKQSTGLRTLREPLYFHTADRQHSHSTTVTDRRGADSHNIFAYAIAIRQMSTAPVVALFVLTA